MFDALKIVASVFAAKAGNDAIRAEARAQGLRPRAEPKPEYHRPPLPTPFTHWGQTVSYRCPQCGTMNHPGADLVMRCACGGRTP